MRMNHINLSVPDVLETCAFLEKYFGLRSFGSPQSEKIVVLMDENDCLIALSNFGNKDEYIYPPTFHVGFNLSSPKQVDAMHARLTADGYVVGKLGELHGAWAFYMKAPGGFMVEVFHQYGMEDIKASLKPALN